MRARRQPGRDDQRSIRRRALVGLTVLLLLDPVPAGAADDEPLEGVDAQLDLYQRTAASAQCELDWALLGGIAGFVSDHGRFGQPVALGPLSSVESVELSGTALVTRLEAVDPPPVPIRGEALDGDAGRRLVTDSDGGELDGDVEYDRAMGPFQFIPATWEAYASDGNGDDVADPDDFSDAAASAAWYLCDLGADTDERAAVIGYFGTDVWLERVAEAEAELRDFERRTRPIAEVATIGPDANVPLVSVRGINVNVDIGAAVEAMLAAAESDGIVLRGWGWRSHERQIELRAAHCADVWETPPADCVPPTAIPGTSLHETGHAIDFFVGLGRDARAIDRPDPEFGWLADNAADHGFFNLESEPWHWSLTGG